MDRPTVDTISSCVKCGYHWGNSTNKPGIKYTTQLPLSYHASMDWHGGETLIRTCPRCGYQWTEAPLDSTSN